MTDETVSVRRLGTLDAAVIHAGLLHVPPQPAWRTEGSRLPIDRLGRPITGINGLLVRGDGWVLVVDPNSWDVPATIESKYAVTDLVPGPPLEESLARLGVRSADVTHVVITHGHWDHYSGVLDRDGNVRFANADHLFPSADWRTFVTENERGDADVIRAHLDPIESGGLLRLVDGDLDLVDGVRVLSTPGESPGHQCVRIVSGDASLYYLGDLFHYPAEFERLEFAGTGRDAERMVASRLAILESARRDAGPLLVFTHGVFPAWGEVEETGTGTWSFRYLAV